MEIIFDYFFENTFQKIARDGLHDRYSRRNVIDHLNAIIGGMSDGQNIRTEEIAGQAVIAAIKYHKNKKDLNGNVCLMGKYHNILYIALRICWEWGVRDSEIVILLLESIYSCEKSFERLLLGALFGTSAPHFIAGWKSDFRDQNENIRAMVYFLEHATNLRFKVLYKTSFDEEKILRFIDIPIESCGRSSPLRVALQASTPEILLILLRYGATPLPLDGGSCPIISLLDKLLENGDEYESQLVSCLCILLKNISLIEMPFKRFTYESRKSMFQQKYGELLIHKVLIANQVFGVMSLKHLCRCEIRNLLRANSQLPGGIDTLRIPGKLKRYIDLMED